MSYSIPQTITELDLVLKGVGHVGVTKNFTLPTIKKIMHDQRVALGTKQIDTGRYEPMTFNAVVQVLSDVAFDMLTSYSLSGSDADIYGYFKYNDGSNKNGVITMRGPVSSIEDSTFETGNIVSRNISIAVNYYNFSVPNGQDFTIDLENHIVKYG